MNETKRSYRGWLFYAPAQLQERLEDMALEGWLLKKLTKHSIEYEKIDPQPLRYTVIYLSESSASPADPTENQQIFVAHCREIGWEFVTQWKQMLIFCSQDERPTPIPTEAKQQLYATNQVMKTGILPIWISQIFITLTLLNLQLPVIFRTPQKFYSTTSTILLVCILLVALLVTLRAPLHYLLWYRRATVAVNGEDDIPEPSYHPWMDSLLAIVFLLSGGVFVLLCLGEMGGSASLSTYLALITSLSFIWIFTKKIARKNLLHKFWARMLFLIGGIILCFTILFTLVVVFIQSGVLSTAPPAMDEPLPLTLEEFMEVDPTRYLYSNHVKESPLLKWSNCGQVNPRGELDIPQLVYEVYETHYLLVYRHMLLGVMGGSLLGSGVDTDWTYVSVPSTTAAYHNPQAAPYHYILCTPTAIVDVTFPSLCDQSQVDTAIALLLEDITL